MGITRRRPIRACRLRPCARHALTRNRRPPFQALCRLEGGLAERVRRMRRWLHDEDQEPIGLCRQFNRASARNLQDG